jgi:protein-tyrosine-phosphatase
LKIKNIQGIMSNKYSVLFVCTANIIRSSIAAAMFKKMMTEEGMIDLWHIDSAGTWTKDGQKVPHEVIAIMKERGLDLHEHRSRSVTKEILHKFSLILTMESGQKEALKIEFPEIADRVYLMAEMSGKNSAISDPIGGRIEEYAQTANEVEKSLVQGRNKIIELAKTVQKNL